MNMKELIGNFAMLFGMITLLFTVIGLFKPTIFIPAKFNVKYRRLIIVIAGFILFVIFANIGSALLPDIDSNTTDKKDNIIEKDSTTTIAEKTENTLNDTSIVRKYEPEYKNLYAKLLDVESDKKDIHRQIKDLIYNQWWNDIEKCDSLKISTKYSRKIYKKCCLEYDKIYAKWIKYGDEDFDRIEFWAQSEAERILNKLCVDPESLKIEKTIVQGKTSKGWKCITQYRAKNGYGGYVREYLTLIIAYDDENDAYTTVDIHEN